MNRRDAPTDLPPGTDTCTDTRRRRRLRFRRSGRLPLLALLAAGAAIVAALIGLTSADPARAQSPAAQSVPSDWALIPDGIEPGDSFRLIFVTSSKRDASSANIADYNSHAQSAAANNTNLSGFSAQFRALISTSSVDARTNTATTGTGVPVHWLGGAKVADDYGDLYDGDWDSVSGKTEAGGSYSGQVWTGGNKAGLKSGQRHAGAAEVRLGDLSDATLPLSSPNSGASGDTYPLYAISPVITVAQPANGGASTADNSGSDTTGDAGDSESAGDADEAGTAAGVDRPGTITFSTNKPVVGSISVVYVSDPDGIVDGSVTWHYQRSVEGPFLANMDDLTWVDTANPNLAGSSNWNSRTHGIGRSLAVTHSETDHWLRVTATYTDSLGAGKSATGRTGEAVRPHMLVRGGAITIPEDLAVGSPVGAPVTVTDAQIYGEGRFQYTVRDWRLEPQPFGIDPRTGQLVLQEILDYELRTSYDVLIQALDRRRGSTGIGTTWLIINVTDVDEGEPTKFPQRSYSFTFPENTPQPLRVSRTPITVNGHTHDGFRYGLGGPDAEHFWLRSTADFPGGLTARDQLMLGAILDYESQSVHKLTLSAYDLSLGEAFTPASLVDTVDVTVNVTDVDEPGSVSLDVYRPYYDEWKRPFLEVI